MLSVKRTFSDQSWEQPKSMGKNTNILRQLDKMIISPNNSSWFVPGAYELPSFGFWPELQYQEFLLVEQVANLIRGLVTHDNHATIESVGASCPAG